MPNPSHDCVCASSQTPKEIQVASKVEDMGQIGINDRVGNAERLECMGAGEAGAEPEGMLC